MFLKLVELFNFINEEFSGCKYNILYEMGFFKNSNHFSVLNAGFQLGSRMLEGANVIVVCNKNGDGFHITLDFRMQIIMYN